MRRPTLEFLQTEAGSGLVLGLAALAGVLAANSSLSWAYFEFLHAPFTVQFGSFHRTASVLDWIKQGLMSVFFLVVGLELKYEALKGELANPRRLALPILAALTGMVVPALIYLAINTGQPVIPGAWATPTATDIAFALAALATASRRLPASLRIFLLTLAVVDDLGAVGLIGLLFSRDLRPGPLAAVGLTLIGLVGVGRWRSAPFLVYGVGFLLVWVFSIQSGAAPSLTAVLAAMTVPVGARKRSKDGMLQQMLQSLHPYVAYGILPLFAFAAAGFSLKGFSWAVLERPALLGILAGLFLGKQIGVFAMAYLASALKLGRKPTGATWLEIYGVALLCGVGFTMSLFIGGLAFGAQDTAGQSDMRIGVALASLLSGALGMAVLAWAGSKRPRPVYAEGS